MLKVWNDKRLVWMISMIHSATVVNTGRRDRKTDKEIKKPYVVQYNKFMKGIDRADQYLSFYSVRRKSVKSPKKVVFYLLNCALFNAFFVYRTLNTKKKVKYKNFPHKVGRSRISEVQNWSESSSDDLQLPEKQTTPRGPKQDPPGRLSRQFRIPKLEKSLVVGRGKRSILQDGVLCLLNIRSKMKLDAFVNSASFLSQRAMFWEITFSEKLLDCLHAVSAFLGSGA